MKCFFAKFKKPHKSFWNEAWFKAVDETHVKRKIQSIYGEIEIKEVRLEHESYDVWYNQESNRRSGWD